MGLFHNVPTGVHITKRNLFAARPKQEYRAKVVRELRPRRFQVHSVVLCNTAQQLKIVHRPAVPPLDSTGSKRCFRVLNDFARIKELLDAQAVTGWAGPGGVVEGKQLWLKLA